MEQAVDGSVDVLLFTASIIFRCADLWMASRTLQAEFNARDFLIDDTKDMLIAANHPSFNAQFLLDVRQKELFQMLQKVPDVLLLPWTKTGAQRAVNARQA